MKKRHVLFLAVAFLLAILLISAGGEKYPENPPLERVDHGEGYYFGNLSLGEGNTDENTPGTRLYTSPIWYSPANKP